VNGVPLQAVKAFLLKIKKKVCCRQYQRCGKNDHHLAKSEFFILEKVKTIVFVMKAF